MQDKRDWILVGMMGAGKSTVGRELARLSERNFADTDSLLQNRFGRSISQIFDVYGEATFRDHEHSILKGLEPEGRVLATGGGIVLREDNWEELRRLGTTIFLETPIETLIERLAVSRKKRPLLEREDWQEALRDLYSRREPLYRKADHTWLFTGNLSESCAHELFLQLKELT